MSHVVHMNFLFVCSLICICLNFFMRFFVFLQNHLFLIYFCIFFLLLLGFLFGLSSTHELLVKPWKI